MSEVIQVTCWVALLGIVGALAVLWARARGRAEVAERLLGRAQERVNRLLGEAAQRESDLAELRYPLLVARPAVPEKAPEGVYYEDLTVTKSGERLWRDVEVTHHLSYRSSLGLNVEWPDHNGVEHVRRFEFKIAHLKPEYLTLTVVEPKFNVPSWERKEEGKPT